MSALFICILDIFLSISAKMKKKNVSWKTFYHFIDGNLQSSRQKKSYIKSCYRKLKLLKISLIQSETT